MLIIRRITERTGWIKSGPRTSENKRCKTSKEQPVVKRSKDEEHLYWFSLAKEGAQGLDTLFHRNFAGPVLECIEAEICKCNHFATFFQNLQDLHNFAPLQNQVRCEITSTLFANCPDFREICYSNIVSSLILRKFWGKTRNFTICQMKYQNVVYTFRNWQKFAKCPKI